VRGRRDARGHRGDRVTGGRGHRSRGLGHTRRRARHCGRSVAHGRADRSSGRRRRRRRRRRRSRAAGRSRGGRSRLGDPGHHTIDGAGDAVDDTGNGTGHEPSRLPAGSGVDDAGAAAAARLTVAAWALDPDKSQNTVISRNNSRPVPGRVPLSAWPHCGPRIRTHLVRRIPPRCNPP
jgi:hypothetical protein